MNIEKVNSHRVSIIENYIVDIVINNVEISIDLTVDDCGNVQDLHPIDLDDWNLLEPEEKTACLDFAENNYSF